MRSFNDGIDFFPYGTQYHRFPTPTPSEWDRDLAEISRLGYTHVQFRPQWRCHERNRGIMTWNDLDSLFSLAQKYHLRVILKPMLETAPDWIFDQLDGTRIGFHGQPIPPIAHSAFYVGGWWPCFDNPAVAKAATKFIEEIVKRYCNHPSLWRYNAWNEPRSRPLGSCHCQHSLTAYVSWLREKYETIDNLNAHLGKAWSSWESFRLPESANDIVEMMQWRQWSRHSIASHIRLVTKAIKRVDPHALVMTHVGACGIIQDPACDTSDDILNSEQVDRYGMSLPINLHPISALTWNQTELCSDWLRRVDPSYWVQEFYPSHGPWSKAVKPNTLRQLVWAAISAGCEGFTYWQWKSERFGEESNGYGLRNIDGSPTPHSSIADDIAGILARHGHILAASRKEAGSIKLLHCNNSDLAGRIAAMRDDAASEKANVNHHYKLSVSGLHTLLIEAGHTVDFVTAEDNLNEDDILVMTAVEIISFDHAQRLISFVERGGRLLVEFPFACLDERPWVEPVRPSHGLETILGCKEQCRTTITSKEAVSISDKKIGARTWRTSFVLSGGQMLAQWSDGSPAAVEHRKGRGRCISLGFSLGNLIALGDDDSIPAQDIGYELLSRLGAQSSMPSHPFIKIRRRIAKDGSVIWFAWNRSDTETSSVAIDGIEKENCEIWDSHNASISNGKLQLGPNGVWVARQMKDNDDKHNTPSKNEQQDTDPQ